MVFGATGGRDVTLHIGLRGQRLPQGQNGPFWGGRNTMERDVLMLAYRSRMLNVLSFFLYLSVNLKSMHGVVSLAHKWWAESLSEQSKVKGVL